MAKPSPTDWHVLAHDPMAQYADNLWRVVGDVPNMALRRAMTVARLPDRGLVLHSAIAMDDAGMKALTGLGEPAWLVVPNGWHRMDAARYKARFPALKVICPPDARDAVAKVVAVDCTYDDKPKLDDAGTVCFETWGGKKRMEGAMVVRSGDGVTLVMCDSLFNLPDGEGFFWWFYGKVMGATGGPRVTPITRMFLTLGGGKKPYKQWLADKAAKGGIVRVIPGHGDVIDHDTAAVLKGLSDSL